MASVKQSSIAFTSRAPILDDHLRPFVFSAVIPGLFNSAISVFSSGTSFRWLRDQLCPDLKDRAQKEGLDVYDLMTSLAATSPVGSRGIIFNPNLAGGTSVNASINIRGAYLGLDLGHSRADLIRATMEGVAMEMRMSLDELRTKMPLSDEMVVVGGGSRSKLWRQIYADVYPMRIIKTNIDQQAAALVDRVGNQIRPNQVDLANADFVVIAACHVTIHLLGSLGWRSANEGQSQNQCYSCKRA